MKINFKHACSFTGHRPERMSAPEKKVKGWLKEQIGKAIEEGYTDFISGMQRGVDIWAAEAVLELKEAGKNVRLFAASAFKGMELEWDVKWQERYSMILAAAEEVFYISNIPGRVAFFKRNDWMVDHSSKLIGVYTGAPGGTKETIEYAKKKGLDIVLYEKESQNGNEK